MRNQERLVITGAAGFIGSFVSSFLNDAGFENLILVDDFSSKEKAENLTDVRFQLKVHRDQFESWCKTHVGSIDYILHLGARTDTTEMDYEVFKVHNLDYSKWIWELCSAYKIPLIYASSAATYGGGEKGYVDDEQVISELHPLNPYGVSKNEFDIWALEQKLAPPSWAGLKFFNVYGPNEYHKGRMASVVFHAFNQIMKGQNVRLFRSHHPDFQDGGQLRDFIYVKDVAKVIFWMMNHSFTSGIYNLGTGKARTFNDLAAAVFRALDMPVAIEFMDTPEDIREKYQYFTEANMEKLRMQGFSEPFYSLEEGVSDYIQGFLIPWHESTKTVD